MALPKDDSLLLLTNPRCSTCRNFVALLDERGVEYASRRYLDQPLDRAELKDLAQRLPGGLASAIRRKEPAYDEAGLTPDASESKLIAALLEHPVLLERPILIRGPRAAVARPAEAALALLDAKRG